MVFKKKIFKKIIGLFLKIAKTTEMRKSKITCVMPCKCAHTNAMPI